MGSEMCIRDRKIYCTRSELNRAINNVSHSIPTRTPSPILEGILIETKDDRMYLTATDTNMTIESNIPVDSEGDVSFVIEEKNFANIVSKLPEEEILMDYNHEKNQIKINSGKSSSTFNCFSADEFPRFNIGEGKKLILSKRDIKNLIRKTSFSASADELNGVLTGILIDLGDGNLRMVAVDTFRMAIYNAKVDTDEKMSIVVPAKLLGEVSKIISDDDNDEQLFMEIVDNKVVMLFDNNRVILNTLNGNYIDYSRIIKSETTIKIRTSRIELMKSIDRAAIIASEQNNNLIKLNIEDEQIEITSLSEKSSIKEMVEIMKDGENIEIGFNSKYMMDVLRVIDDEEIILNMSDSVKPCIITPLKGDTYLYLVLPVRIN